MPSFEVTVEFEVFCGTCGAGLCMQSETRKSRNRGELQVTVEVCQRCVELAKDSTREDTMREMQEEIEKLEEKINELKEALEETCQK